jgi:hypothetical protein
MFGFADAHCAPPEPKSFFSDIAINILPLRGQAICARTLEDDPLAKVNELATPEYQVLINLVWSRRSDKLNLLSCETAGGKITALRQKVFDFHCKLIGERDTIC